MRLGEVYPMGYGSQVSTCESFQRAGLHGSSGEFAGFRVETGAGRARQRDEAAIEQWKRKRRPELKKALPPRDG